MPADRKSAKRSDARGHGHGTPRARRAARRNPTLNEDASLQAERMLVLADLVPGLVHELNSPLSVLLGQAQVLHERLAGGPEATGAARLARAAERCAQVARQFAVLARDASPERTVVALNPVVEETLALFAFPLRAAMVTLERDLGADTPSLLADPHELRVLVASVVRSALRTARERPGERVIRVRTSQHPERGAAVLEVSHGAPTPEAEVSGPDALPPSLFLADQIVRNLGGVLTRPQGGRVFARVEFATAHRADVR